MKPVRLIVLAVTLLATLLSGAQDHPASPRRPSCPPIPTDNPVYADALDIVDALTNAHVNVKCVTLDKMTTAFEGEEGAVYLRTDDSMLHAVFMPRPQDFSNLKVLQKREHDRYIYTFLGNPKIKSDRMRMIGSFAEYFIRYENALIIAFDKQLALQIKKGLPGARILKVWTARPGYLGG